MGVGAENVMFDDSGLLPGLLYRNLEMIRQMDCRAAVFDEKMRQEAFNMLKNCSAKIKTRGNETVPTSFFSNKQLNPVSNITTHSSSVPIQHDCPSHHALPIPSVGLRSEPFVIKDTHLPHLTSHIPVDSENVLNTVDKNPIISDFQSDAQIEDTCGGVHRFSNQLDDINKEQCQELAEYRNIPHSEIHTSIENISNNLHFVSQHGTQDTHNKSNSLLCNFTYEPEPTSVPRTICNEDRLSLSPGKTSCHNQTAKRQLINTSTHLEKEKQSLSVCTDILTDSQFTSVRWLLIKKRSLILQKLNLLHQGSEMMKQEKRRLLLRQTGLSSTNTTGFTTHSTGILTPISTDISTTSSVISQEGRPSVSRRLRNSNITSDLSHIGHTKCRSSFPNHLYEKEKQLDDKKNCIVSDMYGTLSPIMAQSSRTVSTTSGSSNSGCSLLPPNNTLRHQHKRLRGVSYNKPIMDYSLNGFEKENQLIPSDSVLNLSSNDKYLKTTSSYTDSPTSLCKSLDQSYHDNTCIIKDKLNVIKNPTTPSFIHNQTATRLSPQIPPDMSSLTKNYLSPSIQRNSDRQSSLLTGKHTLVQESLDTLQTKTQIPPSMTLSPKLLKSSFKTHQQKKKDNSHIETASFMNDIASLHHLPNHVSSELPSHMSQYQDHKHDNDSVHQTTSEILLGSIVSNNTLSLSGKKDHTSETFFSPILQCSSTLTTPSSSCLKELSFLNKDTPFLKKHVKASPSVLQIPHTTPCFNISDVNHSRAIPPLSDHSCINLSDTITSQDNNMMISYTHPTQQVVSLLNDHSKSQSISSPCSPRHPSISLQSENASELSTHTSSSSLNLVIQSIQKNPLLSSPILLNTSTIQSPSRETYETSCVLKTHQDMSNLSGYTQFNQTQVSQTNHTVENPHQIKQTHKAQINQPRTIQSDMVSTNNLIQESSQMSLLEQEWSGICPACGQGENAFKGSENMVACDCCNDWFHFICVGYCTEPKESNIIVNQVSNTHKKKSKKKKNYQQPVDVIPLSNSLDDKWYCSYCIDSGQVKKEDLEKMNMTVK